MIFTDELDDTFAVTAASLEGVVIVTCKKAKVSLLLEDMPFAVFGFISVINDVNAGSEVFPVDVEMMHRLAAQAPANILISGV